MIEILTEKELKDLIAQTFNALDDVFMNDKYPYNERRFANLLKAMTNTLWRTLSAMIPKINSESKGRINFVEDMMKNWAKLLD